MSCYLQGLCMRIRKWRSAVFAMKATRQSATLLGDFIGGFWGVSELQGWIRADERQFSQGEGYSWQRHIRTDYTVSLSLCPRRPCSGYNVTPNSQAENFRVQYLGFFLCRVWFK